MFDQAEATAQQVGSLRESMASVRRYQAEMIATAVSNPTGVGPLHDAWKKEIALAEQRRRRRSSRRIRPTRALADLVAKQKKLLADVVEIIDPIAQQLTDAKMDATAALAYAGQANDKLDAAAGQPDRHPASPQQAGLAGIRARDRARAR